MPDPFVVRPVAPADLPRVARLAAQLVHYHQALDPERYLQIDDVERGYARFLGGQLTEPEAVVLCAARDADILGYAYGTLEPRDWNALLD